MIVLPDRVVDDGYVLVGDGLVQAIGTGQIPAGEKYGGLDLSCSRVQLIRKSTAAARRTRRILSMAASAQVPSPDMAAKAKELKEADNNYVKVLCHGPKTQLADAKSVRDRLQSDLGKAIADAAALTPAVQKALDAAADAGEGADKIATSGSASDQDKAEAHSRLALALVARGEATIRAHVPKPNRRWQYVRTCPLHTERSESFWPTRGNRKRGLRHSKHAFGSTRVRRPW
jgi:hypothetical protein